MDQKGDEHEECAVVAVHEKAQIFTPSPAAPFTELFLLL
jgi:hypothetical protein